MGEREVAVLHGLAETRIVTLPPLIALLRDPCFQTFGYGVAVGQALAGHLFTAFGIVLLAHKLRPDRSGIIELPELPFGPGRPPTVGERRRAVDVSTTDTATVGGRA